MNAMPAIADPQPPLMDEIEVKRVRDGKEATERLWVEYHAPYATIPAIIVIAQDWSQRKHTDQMSWRSWCRYEVTEFAPDEPGRAFRLRRDPEYVEALAVERDHSPTYSVLIAPTPAGDRCDCRGQAATQPHGRTCKHVSALRHWIKEQVI